MEPVKVFKIAIPELADKIDNEVIEEAVSAIERPEYLDSLSLFLSFRPIEDFPSGTFREEAQVIMTLHFDEELAKSLNRDELTDYIVQHYRQYLAELKEEDILEGEPAPEGGWPEL